MEDSSILYTTQTVDKVNFVNSLFIFVNLFYN